MLSDASETELLDFAIRIGLPMRWYQARSSVPHFDLSPGWRKKAVAAGALPVDRYAFVEAMKRWRARRSS